MFVLGSTIQEKHGTSPAMGHKDDYEIGAPDIKGQVERKRIFQPGEEKSRGRRQNQALLRGIQWKEERK